MQRGCATAAGRCSVKRKLSQMSASSRRKAIEERVPSQFRDEFSRVSQRLGPRGISKQRFYN